MVSEINHFEQLEFRVGLQFQNDDTDNKVGEVTAVGVSAGADAVAGFAMVLDHTVSEQCHFTPVLIQTNFINYNSTNILTSRF